MKTKIILPILVLVAVVVSIALLLSKTGYIDNFDDGKLNENFWGILSQGGGVAHESNGVFNIDTKYLQAALLYGKSPLKGKYVISYLHKMGCCSSDGEGTINIWNTDPFLDSSLEINKFSKVRIWQDQNGDFAIVYWDESGQVYYWNNAIQSWQTGNSWFLPADLNTSYYLEIMRNNTKYTAKIYTDTNELLEEAIVPISLVRDGTENDYFGIGEPFTSSQSAVNIEIDNFAYSKKD